VALSSFQNCSANSWGTASAGCIFGLKKRRVQSRRREIRLAEVTLNQLGQEKCNFLINSDEFTWLEGLNRRRVSTHFRASATLDLALEPTFTSNHCKKLLKHAIKGKDLRDLGALTNQRGKDSNAYEKGLKSIDDSRQVGQNGRVWEAYKGWFDRKLTTTDNLLVIL
jgi:hypothetical protein